MRLLEELGLKELREVASDLSAMLDRDIKGVSTKNVRADVLAGFEEVDRETALSICRMHDLDSSFLGDAAESTESDSNAEGSEGAADPEEAETGTDAPAEEPVLDDVDPADLEPGTIDDPEAYEKAKADGTVTEHNPPLKASLPHAIQIREHPIHGRFQYGEIVINPSAELCSTHTHAKLSEEGVKRLVARGSRVRKE